MTNDPALAPLVKAHKDLALVVRSLPEGFFFAPLRGWSARDIVAHLIGWNRLMIEAAGSILRGETPGYYGDAPHTYRNINAALVAAYPSPEREELLGELETSMAEFTSFVTSLPLEELDNHHGVLHYSGRPATVGGIIRSLAQDYRDHADEIRALGGGQVAGG